MSSRTLMDEIDRMVDNLLKSLSKNDCNLFEQTSSNFQGSVPLPLELQVLSSPFREVIFELIDYIQTTRSITRVEPDGTKLRSKIISLQDEVNEGRLLIIEAENYDSSADLAKQNNNPVLEKQYRDIAQEFRSKAYVKYDEAAGRLIGQTVDMANAPERTITKEEDLLWIFTKVQAENAWRRVEYQWRLEHDIPLEKSYDEIISDPDIPISSYDEINSGIINVLRNPKEVDIFHPESNLSPILLGQLLFDDAPVEGAVARDLKNILKSGDYVLEGSRTISNLLGTVFLDETKDEIAKIFPGIDKYIGTRDIAGKQAWDHIIILRNRKTAKLIPIFLQDKVNVKDIPSKRVDLVDDMFFSDCLASGQFRYLKSKQTHYKGEDQFFNFWECQGMFGYGGKYDGIFAQTRSGPNVRGRSRVEWDRTTELMNDLRNPENYEDCFVVISHGKQPSKHLSMEDGQSEVIVQQLDTVFGVFRPRGGEYEAVQVMKQSPNIEHQRLVDSIIILDWFTQGNIPKSDYSSIPTTLYYHREFKGKGKPITSNFEDEGIACLVNLAERRINALNLAIKKGHLSNSEMKKFVNYLNQLGAIFIANSDLGWRINYAP